MSRPPVFPPACMVFTLAGLVFILARLACAQTPPAPLPSPASIRSIKLEANVPGEARPAEIEATVTHATPPGYSARELVVEDATGGVWVTGPVAARAAVSPGMLLRILGRRVPGKFSPTFLADVITIMPAASQPVPRAVPVESLLSGDYDSAQVEVTGRVRSVRELPFAGDPWVLVTLGTRSRRVHALIPAPLGDWASGWVGSVVRVHGVCAHYFSSSGQILNAQLRVSSPDRIQVSQGPPAAIPLVPVRDLLTFQPGVTFEHRIRTRGTVTARDPRSWIFIMDGDAGCRVWTDEPMLFPIGTEVEALGFTLPGSPGPEIEDASVAAVGTGRRAVAGAATFDEALGTGGRLLTVRGRLFSIEPMGDCVRLRLETGGREWTATVPRAPGAIPPEVTPDATIDVTGISFVTMAPDPVFGSYPAFVSFEIAARDGQDLVVVKPKPWWTAERLRVGGGASVLASCALAALAVRQRRRYARLAEGREALKKAGEELARTVETRTKQMQEQLVLQHLSRSEAAAVMAERARVARDLHDSLGQTLASAKWRVETLSESSFEGDLQARSGQLRAVFGLLDSCQKELQRSVWNLCNPERDRGQLSKTVREAVHLLFHKTGIAADVAVTGSPRPLPLCTETNLLHLTQEALANVLKHAAARRVWILLSYETRSFQLAIRDDGCGFDSAVAPGGNPGANHHFGFHNMRERAEAIGADLRIASTAGGGTSIRLTLRLAPTDNMRPEIGGEPLVMDLSVAG